MSIVNVRSEVGKLRKMLVHRPGEELNNLVPHYLEWQLFDDIPWLKVAREEHDAYVATLRSVGVEVLYIEELVTSLIEDEGLKRELIDRFIVEAKVYSSGKREKIRAYLCEMAPKDIIDTMISGLRKTEIPVSGNHLSDYLISDYPFVLDPMPNMYFTRDPFSFVGNGVILSKMYKEARRRETLFGEFLLNNHPDFVGTAHYHERDARFAIEGGDVMVLRNDILAIGVSQRTDVNAVEEVARKLLSDPQSGFKKVIAVDIPKTRSFMHLDTVFTMVDRNVFAVHPTVEHEFKMFELSYDDGVFKVKPQEMPVKDVLKKQLELDDVRLIACGGTSYVDSAREQWNDGANTLAVAPGEIVVYARNVFTNKLYKDNGIKLHEIPCSELSRGRGGPHCMSMAITRDEL